MHPVVLGFNGTLRIIMPQLIAPAARDQESVDRKRTHSYLVRRMEVGMRRLVFLTAWLVSLSAFAVDNAPPPAPEQAAALMREIESRFAGLPSLRYQVECATRNGRQSQTERWTFAYQAPDRIRIDYHEPVARTILIDPVEMWEYIPQARKAMRTDLSPLSDGEKARRIAAVSARVAVDGLHPGALPDDLPQASVSPLDPGWWRLQGEKPRVCFDLDPLRKVLVRSEVFTSENRLAVRTEASDFQEAAPGFWIPRQIRCTYERDDSFVQRQIQLDQIEIGQPIPEETFRFSPPTGVEILGDAPR